VCVCVCVCVLYGTHCSLTIHTTPTKVSTSRRAIEADPVKHQVSEINITAMRDELMLLRELVERNTDFIDQLSVIIRFVVVVVVVVVVVCMHAHYTADAGSILVARANRVGHHLLRAALARLARPPVGTVSAVFGARCAAFAPHSSRSIVTCNRCCCC
jgi:hypothetical protein